MSASEAVCLIIGFLVAFPIIGIVSEVARQYKKREASLKRMEAVNAAKGRLRWKVPLFTKAYVYDVITSLGGRPLSCMEWHGLTLFLYTEGPAVESVTKKIDEVAPAGLRYLVVRIPDTVAWPDSATD